MIRLATLISVAALAAAPLAAHVGDTVYPVYELPTSQLPDLHDGTLADWEEVLPGASIDFHDFVSLPGVGDSAPVDPADLAYRFFLAWHGATGRLYIGFERVDDAYVNEYDGGDAFDMWRYDNFEVLVDGDHSGGEYAAFAENAEHLAAAQAQQYLVLPESPDDHPLRLWRPGKDFEIVYSPPWVSSRPTPTWGASSSTGCPRSRSTSSTSLPSTT